MKNKSRSGFKILFFSLVLIAFGFYMKSLFTPSSEMAESSDFSSLSPEKEKQLKEESQDDSKKQPVEKNDSRKPDSSLPFHEKSIADQDTEISRYLKQLDPGGDWKILRSEHGLITSISGGQIPQGSSQDLLNHMAEFLGIPVKDLKAKSESENDSGISAATVYEQHYEDYKVLQAGLRIFTRKSDGTQFMITNETKPIVNPNLNLNLKADQALASARSHYGTNAVSALASNEPLIYQPPKGSAQLIWLTVVKDSPKSLMQNYVLISADTGAVLRISPATKRN